MPSDNIISKSCELYIRRYILTFFLKHTIVFQLIRNKCKYSKYLISFNNKFIFAQSYPNLEWPVIIVYVQYHNYYILASLMC